MRYRLLGNSELKVSTIGLGTWVLGGDHWGPIDDRESIATIQKAIDCGINLVDTAPAYGYGHSEELIGKAMGKLGEIGDGFTFHCGFWSR